MKNNDLRTLTRLALLVARAIESGDQELCSGMLDTSVAVSRVLTVARRSAGLKF